MHDPFDLTSSAIRRDAQHRAEASVGEIVARAQGRGVRTRVVYATPSAAAVPLGCLTQVLRPRIDARPELLSSPALFHEAVAALIAEATDEGPWLLAVDDVPHLDDASAAALHQCLQTTSAPFIGTAREDEARPEAIDALWRQGRLELQAVAPLTDGAVAELADQAVPGDLTSRARHRLVELAAGNPLALRELLASARDTGALRLVHGIWDLIDGYQAGRQVQALVAHRLAATDPGARRVLELVALAEPVPFAILATLSGPDLLDGLIDRSLIRVEDDGGGPQVRSGHPLHGDVLRSQLPPGRRRQLAAQLQAALPADAATGPGLLRRAVLHLETGAPPDLDVELVGRAAMAARYAGDHALAIRFADVARSIPERSGQPAAALATAALAGATARLVIDEVEPGDGGFVELAARAVHAMSDSLDGPSAAALESAERAAVLFHATVGTAPNRFVVSTSGMLYALGELRGFEAAAAVGRERVRLARTGVEYLDYVGLWHGVIAAQAVFMGVLTEATLADADEAVRFLRWRDPGGLLSFAVASRGCFAALCGDLATADRYLDEYDADFRARELKTTTPADRGRAWLAFQRGQVDEAIGWAERAHSASWDTADVALWAAPAAHDLVRFGRPELAVGPLAAAQRRLRSPFSAALLAQARALHQGNARALVAVVGALRACDAHGLAAEGLAWAAGLAPAEGARLRRRALELLDDSLMRTPALAALDPSRGTVRSDGGDATAASATAAIRIERLGRAWRISFDGTEATVPHLTGLAYLAVLVDNPGRRLRAVVLASGGARPPQASHQAILDTTARRSLEQRARDVAVELGRARRLGQGDLVDRLGDEADALAAELSRQGGPGAGGRAFADGDERARTAVRKAIVRALAEVAEVHPAAADHLRSRVTTGSTCVFTPQDTTAR